MKEITKNGVTISSLKETHAKCPRCRCMTCCWGNFGHTKQEIEADPKLAREKLCQRCADIILLEFPDHESAFYIRLYNEKQKNQPPILKFEDVILWA